MSNQKDHSVVGIQYLRGLAALFVVIDHTAALMPSEKYLGRGPGTALGYGQVGVDIFFVISGFIITLVSLGPDLRPRLTRLEFLRRRFVRIIPFLWVSVLGYAGLRLFARGSFEATPYVRAMFLWPVGELRPNVVWTLRHEALFYAVFCLTMLGARRRPGLLALWLVSPLLCAAIKLVAPLPGGTLGELVQLVASPLNLEFAVGVVIGWVYVSRGQAAPLAARPGPVLVAVAATGIFVVAAVLRLHEVSFARGAVLAPVSGAVVLFGLGARGDGPLRALGTLLGDASYAIYLMHNICVLALFDAMAALHLRPNVYVAEVVVVTLATAGGVMVHLFVEKPVVRFARNLLRPASLAVGTHSA